VSLERGLEHLRQRAWFEAHEAFEDEWRGTTGEERDFLQGLVHVAVAWHHAANGNQRGAAGQLEKAARRLATYAPEHRGVDVEQVLGRVEAARARVAVGLLDLLPVLQGNQEAQALPLRTSRARSTPARD
jgi:predicted metal-dependent hydrolase